MRRISTTPEDTFALGRDLGGTLKAGDVLLLYGGLGAGKTLFTKGILDALDYNVDEVTSPSFALVNLYKTPEVDVYHVDLWRLEEGHDPVTSIGLDELAESCEAITIVEWADKLGDNTLTANAIKIVIKGDGDQARRIDIRNREDYAIAIRKGERKLDLLHGDNAVETFDIALGSEPQGQKEREGDGRTPEGEFYIFAKNPESKHHLSLAISYPDIAAVENGFAKGLLDQNTRNQIVHDIEDRSYIPQKTPLGGEIYIHGGGTASDWTDGCIALSDEAIEKVFEKAEIGTPVTISA